MPIPIHNNVRYSTVYLATLYAHISMFHQLSHVLLRYAFLFLVKTFHDRPGQA